MQPISEISMRMQPPAEIAKITFARVTDMTLGVARVGMSRWMVARIMLVALLKLVISSTIALIFLMWKGMESVMLNEEEIAMLLQGERRHKQSWLRKILGRKDRRNKRHDNEYATEQYLKKFDE